MVIGLVANQKPSTDAEIRILYLPPKYKLEVIMDSYMKFLAMFVDGKPISITRDNFSELGQYVYCAIHDTYEWYDSYDELMCNTAGAEVESVFFVPNEYALDGYLEGLQI